MMGRFFFDLGTAEGVFADDRGAEFDSVEEAYLNACDAALEITTQVLALRSRMTDWRFEIRDAERRPVMEVTFEEIQQLREASDAERRSEYQQLWLKCVEAHNRAKDLTAELRQGFDEARETLSAIRAALRQLNGDPTDVT